MRTLASEIQTAMAELNQTGIWCYLFDIVVDDETTLRLTDGVRPVLYNGIEYTPYPILLGEVNDTTKPEVHNIRLTVPNLDRMLSYYLEQDKIQGHQVTITLVHIPHD